MELIIGAAVFLAGILVGRFLPGRRKAPKPPKPPKPVCGCEHHYSLHDPATGKCHGNQRGASTVVTDAKGNPVKDTYGYVQKAPQLVPCGCRRYTGPEPLPAYFAPEIQ